MKILVLNSGSSSIKFKLLQMPLEKIICSGMVERIGYEDAILRFKKDDINVQETVPIKTHREGLSILANYLTHPQKGAIKNPQDIHAVGHRVVHGGDSFAETTLINGDVKNEINYYSALAPLHNPPNLEGIEIAEKLFPTAKQVAVFDTAFYQTMPIKARKYAIPNTFYTEDNIKVYGFHGTSHKYVSEKAIKYLGKETSKIISIHLGNGCSMTAIVNGTSVDHSLGFAPSNGLIMGSRSGDIDHSVIFYLAESLGYSLNEIKQLLNKKSGMLGLTGSSDLRDIQAKAEEGDKNCQLAIDMNAYRIKKYIGGYAAAMNGLDALIFTAGIGENSSLIRRLACLDMDYLGIQLDLVKNEKQTNELREINTDSSQVKILVIPTNEELEIAKQVLELLS
ncbi:MULTISPECIES: acetate/propionate family kinase [Maribacter]|uniref:Acetate kinase n=1 Tax=Maribacter flavus TaxID=1658664 RepID=A0ABU7IG41_9FLAO|nr:MULTISPECIES: acetate kinase [Maribacter]MDC6405275.1 acetate kinase [Maribacter sp. PR66]MEE1971916.1 acetate kinase [Maribacter flavus]